MEMPYKGAFLEYYLLLGAPGRTTRSKKLLGAGQRFHIIKNAGASLGMQPTRKNRHL